MSDERTLWERLTGVPASDNPAYRRGGRERERFLRSETRFPYGRSRYADVAPMPPMRSGSTGAPRVDISGAVDPESPAAFGNFADYANTTMNLQTGDGVGGPEPMSQAHDIIPDAPNPTWEEENAAAMREAMARGEADADAIGLPFEIYPSLAREAETNRRLSAVNREMQAERMRREGTSFEQWRRNGGRPAYPLFNIPDDKPAYSQGARR